MGGSTLFLDAAITESTKAIPAPAAISESWNVVEVAYVGPEPSMKISPESEASSIAFSRPKT
jgi:hypothetical protein